MKRWKYYDTKILEDQYNRDIQTLVNQDFRRIQKLAINDWGSGDGRKSKIFNSDDWESGDQRSKICSGEIKNRETIRFIFELKKWQRKTSDLVVLNSCV